MKNVLEKNKLISPGNKQPTDSKDQFFLRGFLLSITQEEAEKLDNLGLRRTFVLAHTFLVGKDLDNFIKIVLPILESRGLPVTKFERKIVKLQRSPIDKETLEITSDDKLLEIHAFLHDFWNLRSRDLNILEAHVLIVEEFVSRDIFHEKIDDLDNLFLGKEINEEEKALTTENASVLEQPIVGDHHDKIREFLLSLDESKVKELSDSEVLDLFKKAKLFEATGKAIQLLAKEIEERNLGISKSDPYFMGKSDKKFPFLIVRGIKNILSKQQQQYLRDQLVSITKEAKKTQKPLLKTLWEELNLGLLSAPLKIVKDDRFFIKNFISYTPPENSAFNRDNLIVLGESKDFICLGTNAEKDIQGNFVDKTILKWSFNSQYVLQFPFDTKDGLTRIETKHKRELSDYQEANNILQKTEKIDNFVPYLDKKISFYNTNDEKIVEKEFRFIDIGEFVSGIQKSDEYHEYFLSSEITTGKLICKKIDEHWYITKTEESFESVSEIQETQKTEKAFCFIEKVNQEKRMVYGPVLIPEEVDGQGDIISKDVIQEAAWTFLEEYGTVGFMHTVSQTVEGIKHQVEHAIDMKYSVEQLFYGTNDPLLPGIQKVLGRPKTFSDKLKVRESYLAPVDFKLGSKQIKEGTWIMGSYVISDLLWEDVKSGKLIGYSIGGEAEKNPS